MLLENRVGLLGDVHAEDELLEEALRRLSHAGVERTLCVGDIADGPGSIDRACALLAEHRVVAVRGNHDRWLLADTARDLPHAVRLDQITRETAEYLGALPRMRELSSPYGCVLLCHGLGPNDMGGVTPDDFGYAIESNLDLQRVLAEPEIRIVLNGHTHKPMVRRFGDLTIVNGGTLFREHDPGYVIIDFASGDVVWHALGSARDVQRQLGTLRPLAGPE